MGVGQNLSAKSVFPLKTTTVMNNLAFGTQIMIAILQASVAYHYHVPLTSIGITTKHEDPETPWWLQWFNEKSKKVVKIVEMLFKGFLELVKALNEIGIMNGRRR